MTQDEAQSVGVTGTVIDQVAELVDRAPLPEDVLEVARHCVLDWFSSTIGGCREPLVLKLIDEAREHGGNPACAIIGHKERTSALFATLINASAADALDFSDINLAMRGHTVPAIVATAFAMTEAGGLSGRDLVKAVIAAVETACRVGFLANKPILKKGFHPTGNLVIFGAAAAAASILGLNRMQWAHALGIAATQAAGLLASGGTMSKPFHSGRAAMSGLLAARLAKRNFIGRPDAIEAPDGFFETHAAKHDAEELFTLRERYFILDTLFKSHAACQLTHGTIENMLALKSREDIMPDAIRHIAIEVAPVCLTVCNIQEPTTGLQAKFSLRVVAAMTLLGDDTRDIHAYTDARAVAPAICKLRDRMSVKAVDGLSVGGSVATIEMTDGRILKATNDSYAPQGGARAQRRIVTEKFKGLVDPSLGKEAASKLQEGALEVDRLSSVIPLVELATAPRS